MSNERLKIAFISYRSDPLSGGQGIYIKNVSEALAKLGHKVTVFSGNPLPKLNGNIRLVEIDTPKYYETFDFFERFKLFRKRTPNLLELTDFLETSLGIFTEPKFFGKRLSKDKIFLKEFQDFDIFHDNQSLSEYPPFVNDRLVATIHHPIHIDKKIDIENEKGFFMKLAIKNWYSFLNFQTKNLKNYRYVICPSLSSKKDIEKYFKFDASKIEVLWNGLNIENHFVDRTQVKKQSFVSIISSDVPMKNMKNLLLGFSLIKSEYPSAKLNLIGDLRENNKEFIKKLNLEESVVLFNSLSKDRLIDVLEKSDIGVAPSLYEGFGFPLIEMMSMGLPVIVANSGSLPEIAGDNAIIFNPASPNELAQKMKMLLRNDSLNKMSSNNSLLRTDDFFGWDEYARRLEVIYQKILSGIV